MLAVCEKTSVRHTVPSLTLALPGITGRRLRDARHSKLSLREVVMDMVESVRVGIDGAWKQCNGTMSTLVHRRS
jgi:hypothetical protein